MLSVTLSLLYLVSSRFPLMSCAIPAWSTLDQTPLHDTSSTNSDIQAALKKAEIIPDGTLPTNSLSALETIRSLTSTTPVLNSFNPTFSISVKYPKTHVNVKLGNTLPPSAVSSAPDVILQPLPSSETPIPTPTFRTNVTYTLAMTDPDATSRAHPVMGEMCHWIVTGISFQMPASDQPATLAPAHIGLGATDLTDQDVSITNITELMSYLTPSPPPKTGLHRYVFVLLAPAASDALDLSGGLKKPKERPHWGYGKVGKGVRDWARENGLVAIGANFFYAQNEQEQSFTK